MCGIVVWVHRNRGVEPKRLAKAVGALRHRGPDSQNLWFSGPDGQARSVDLGREPEPEGGGYTVGLGHARLSILDLDPRSHQPMFSPEGESVLVYNGEIYNYLELRQEMEAKGEAFATTSDTEVLLRGLAREGSGAMRRMNGMWALAMLHRPSGRIILSRDRYGKKPLFYYRDEEQFIAASEYKAIFAILGQTRQVEPSFVYGFLMSKRWPVFQDFRTMYKGVRSLEPGSTMTYDPARHELSLVNDNSIENYLDLPLNPPDGPPIPPEVLLEEVYSAVDLRLRSDVPVGVLVSGGVDSTAIAACAVQSKLKDNVSFYTIDTNDKEDIVYARKLADALGIRLVEVESKLPDEEMLACYHDILRHFELPVFLGLVVLPGHLIFRKMAADGVKVALDGTGGDEVLGGYPGYFHLALENSMRAQKWRYAYRIKRMVDARPSLRCHTGLGGWLRFLRRTAMPWRRPPEKHITDSRADLFGRHARHADREHLESDIQECFIRDRLWDLTDIQRNDLWQGQMAAYLYIVDQVSMTHSVETRSPLMDYRLYKYLRMPLEQKFHKGYNKYLFRQSLPASVPDEIRWREAKSGFSLTPKALFANRRGEMESLVRDSAVLRECFDLGPMLDELKGLEDKSHFRELLEHMYSVALLESLVPMRP